MKNIHVPVVWNASAEVRLQFDGRYSPGLGGLRKLGCVRRWVQTAGQTGSLSSCLHSSKETFAGASLG